MIDDFATFSEGARFETNVCIVGAGAAGITIAQQLLNSGINVLLLESGGRDYEGYTQDLIKGESVGFPYYPLEESRLRFFGGTTAVWGGRSAQLDEIDFQKRHWVEHSGWPFQKESLRSCYRKAQELLELNPVDDNLLPGFKSKLEAVQPAFWQFDEKFDRFTINNCTELVSSSKVRILLHATAVELVPADHGLSIESIQIASPQNRRGSVHAETFILATGGLEVPRLLLASRHEKHPKGVGNNHDLVGRFFMEHPHARGGQIIPKDPRQFFKLLPRFIRKDGERFGMLFRSSSALQEKEGILNSCFSLGVRKHPGGRQVLYKHVYNNLRHEISPTRFGRGMWKITRRASIHTQNILGPFLDLRKLGKKGSGLYAVIRAEQAPNPDSRITLSEKRDLLGMQRIVLDWRMSEIDKYSIDTLMNAFDKELRRLDLGTVEPTEWLSDDGKRWDVDPLISNHPIGGYHHMGTTRMAESPNRGVVDEDCRIHDIANLYVAGSSVFPTGGWANPTLTILALAIRLADQVRRNT